MSMFRPIETDKIIVLVNVAYKVLVSKVISTTVLRFAKIPTSLLKAQTFVFFPPKNKLFELCYSH